MLLSQSGKHIDYQEVESKRLLDYLDCYERVHDPDTVFNTEQRKSQGNLGNKIFVILFSCLLGKLHLFPTLAIVIRLIAVIYPISL